MIEFEEIIKRYRELLIPSGEAVNLLLTLISAENLEHDLGNFPQEVIEIAERYELGLTEETFKIRRWYRFFSVLIDSIDLHAVKRANIFDDRHFRNALCVTIPERQRFRINRDIKATVVPFFRAPFSDQFEAVLESGTVAVTTAETFEGVMEVRCIPENYDVLQNSLVPTDYQTDPFYTGYYLEINLLDLLKHCDMLE